jgi:DNA-binding response OmpR family regulator/EAL domain-containing protein (putative c-di-GMP-specific phosphodiesterase class I)
MDDAKTGTAARQILAQAAELAARGTRLVDEWPVVEMAQLYEQVDNVAAAAELPGAEAVSTAALELAVYLSALVESGQPASSVQRERARGLIARLADAAGATTSVGTAPATARTTSHRVVYYLRGDDRELPGLVQQLAQERFVTRSFSDADRAFAEVRNLPPHALVVDQGFIPALAKMIEVVERAGNSGPRRPLVLALCDGSDLRQRLFAQRAGADSVLEGADALHTVERLMALFLHQGREDARVLVIDDDTSTAMLCAKVLAHKGIGSMCVHNAREGLDAIASYRPDLVLLDLYLPDMNGIEVAQMIRERPDMALAPIVFLSGEEDIEQRFDAIRMGGDDFLCKPVKPRHLLASVTGRLGRLRRNGAVGGIAAIDPRSGRIDRATLVHEIERARRGELGECVGLVMLSVDDVPALAKRLGFVRAGDLALQVGTAFASESALASGVCALGDFSFLALLPVSGDGALRIAAENLRARLSGRGWMSADAPVRVSFSLGGARADAPGLDIDDLVAQVAEAVQVAQQHGGGRSEWAVRAGDEAPVAPEVKLAHAILRRPLTEDTTAFRYRALVPLHGQLANQFLVDFSLLAPKASQGQKVGRAVFKEVAQSLNVMRAVDRFQVHVLGQRACRATAAFPDLRILVPMSADTLFDPAFPQWLAADLHGLHCDADALALVFDIRQLLADVARASRALEAIQTAGVRLCLSGFSDFDRDQQRLCRLPSVYANLFEWNAASNEWHEIRARLVAESLKHGKLVVMCGVDDPAPLGELFRDGVHYVTGDAVAHWSDDLATATRR